MHSHSYALYLISDFLFIATDNKVMDFFGLPVMWLLNQWVYLDVNYTRLQGILFVPVLAVLIAALRNMSKRLVNSALFHTFIINTGTWYLTGFEEGLILTSCCQFWHSEVDILVWSLISQIFIF